MSSAADVISALRVKRLYFSFIPKQCQNSRSVLQDGSGFFGIVFEERNREKVELNENTRLVL